jgi:drug/metabolite transporter (DMT)-like permease
MVYSANVCDQLLLVHADSARNTVWYWGIFLGVINMGASGFQQWGISMTSASKVAFIAGFDLFLTPIFSLCIPTFKSNAAIDMTTWIAVFFSIFGIFLLSGATMDDMEVGMGESLTLVSTVFWTLHITYTDIATNYVDTMAMMCVQLGFVTFMSSILAYWFEPQQWLWDHMYMFFPWLLFLAVSEGLGFILMALGQNVAPPTHAAIILSLEGDDDVDSLIIIIKYR